MSFEICERIINEIENWNRKKRKDRTMNTAQDKKWETIQKQIFRFNTLANAQTFADRYEKIHRVVLGDNEEYWVAVPAVTEWLVKNGYEYAQ